MEKLRLEWEGYYPFEEKAIRDKVSDRAGVFKVSRLQKDGSLKPFLTGQAASVRMKLLEVLTASKDPCVKEKLQKGDCQFRFAYLYTKEELDGAERALYKRYTARCNDQAAVPDVEDVEINHN